MTKPPLVRSQQLPPRARRSNFHRISRLPSKEFFFFFFCVIIGLNFGICSGKLTTFFLFVSNSVLSKCYFPFSTRIILVQFQHSILQFNKLERAYMFFSFYFHWGWCDFQLFTLPGTNSNPTPVHYKIRIHRFSL